MATPDGLNIGCLYCHKRVRWHRGVCSACLVKIYERVRKGECTWEELERQGKALPPSGTRFHYHKRGKKG